MYIDQMLYPVQALGPGKRIAIWTVGCTRGCPGCSNPELWSREGRHSVPVSEILRAITAICDQYPVDGFTISGGEPMDQAEELLELVRGLSVLSGDILVFSGYSYEELLEREAAAAVLDWIAVLVDGEYRAEQNQQLILRGSANQRVLLFEMDLESRYEEYLSQRNSKIQNLHFGDESISIGIHAQNFRREIDERLGTFGVRSVEHGERKVAQ